MSLSQKNQVILVVAMADKSSANALISAVNARSALSASAKKVLAIAMTSRSGIKGSTVDEVAAAVVSGANLSLAARRRLLIMMANSKAGNDLIDFIQSTPQSNPTKI